MTLTDRGGKPALVVNAKSVEERKGARAMTPKEKVRVHVLIERENKRKLKEWQEAQRRERKSA